MFIFTVGGEREKKTRMKGCFFVGHHQNVELAAALPSSSFESSFSSRRRKIFRIFFFKEEEEAFERRRSKSPRGSHEGERLRGKTDCEHDDDVSSAEEEVTTKRRNQVIVSPSIAKANLWDLKQCVEKVIEGARSGCTSPCKTAPRTRRKYP